MYSRGIRKKQIDRRRIMESLDSVAFARALPKVELHAHLTGSISRETLRLIWRSKKAVDPSLLLEDPLTAIPPANEGINVATFFPLFDSYIYNLITTLADIRLATLSVLSDFEQDNVAYVELRTTPRAIESANISKADYVSTVLDVMSKFNKDSTRMHCCLILSVDRRHTLQQAEEIVDLALANRVRGVVGIDLCGSPLRGDVTTLKPAFARAKANGLSITLHFGEVAASGTIQELQTMLDMQPERIGHVIHVPKEIKEEIKRRRLGLELCLSCNVLAQLTRGGFAGHHFSEWRNSECPIALSTDDVGIFQSPLSNEYWLAMEHFSLSRTDLVTLGRRAIECIFGSTAQKARLHTLLDNFALSTSTSTPLAAIPYRGVQEVASHSHTHTRSHSLPSPSEPPWVNASTTPANSRRHSQQAAMRIETITTSNSDSGDGNMGHERKDSACTTTSKKTPAEAAFVSPVSPTEQRGHSRKRTAEQAMFEDMRRDRDADRENRS